jgi:hypothetical protein
VDGDRAIQVGDFIQTRDGKFFGRVVSEYWGHGQLRRLVVQWESGDIRGPYWPQDFDPVDADDERIAEWMLNLLSR